MKYKMTKKDTFRFLYLERLCKLYVKFMKNYDHVHVWEDEGMVYVKWFREKALKDAAGRVDRVAVFTMREFPVKDLAKKIVSYKRKINREYKTRHDA